MHQTLGQELLAKDISLWMVLMPLVWLEVVHMRWNATSLNPQCAESTATLPHSPAWMVARCTVYMTLMDTAALTVNKLFTLL